MTEVAIFESSLRIYPHTTGDARGIRQEAEEALVKMGPIAVGAIQPRLSDHTHIDYVDGRGQEFFVSDRAANLLRRIGIPAVPALIDALCSEQYFARENAAKVLRELTGQNFGSEYSQWSQWFRQQQNQ